MLEIQNLSVYANDKQIIDNLNLTIKEGEIHVLMGPNGVGKSTICKVLMKSPDYQIQNGQILLDGIDISNLDTTQISQAGFFYISQNPIAIEGVTNAEMLRMALNAKTDEKINIFAFNKKCNAICEKINLPKTFLHRSINDGMSGGERKKNELLHLWMLEPNVILLDEIDSGLDVDALKTVATSIMEYYREKKPSILMITHHPQILNIITPNYVHILKNGHIIHSGDISLAHQIEKAGFNGLYESKELSEKDQNE
ncbi:MAG: Fe-S cluster assembly ATPase SufC [Bacilli bacterium]|jgi:Fe-S cluster assembly ATP-binding protein|nr:Fe-S cluster assembly ATPase SufC [Bacilli bacterium]